MKTDKIQLSSIKLGSLNAECLMAVNMCVRYIKKHHDKQLRMQDKDVLMKISQTVRKVDDPDLSKIYKDLKAKLLICVVAKRA